MYEQENNQRCCLHASANVHFLPANPTYQLYPAITVAEVLCLRIERLTGLLEH